MFPIKVKQKHSLDRLSEPDFNLLYSELIRLKIDNITINETRLEFKNSFFNGQGRHHLMAAVDSGNFFFNKEAMELIYTFSTKRMFLIVLIMSTFFALMLRSYLTGIFFFTWLYGINVVITIIRHKRFFKRIYKTIVRR